MNNDLLAVILIGCFYGALTPFLVTIMCFNSMEKSSMNILSKHSSIESQSGLRLHNFQFRMQNTPWNALWGPKICLATLNVLSRERRSSERYKCFHRGHIFYSIAVYRRDESFKWWNQPEWINRLENCSISCVFASLSVKAIIYVPLYTHIHYIIQNTHTSGHFLSTVKQDDPVERFLV